MGRRGQCCTGRTAPTTFVDYQQSVIAVNAPLNLHFSDHVVVLFFLCLHFASLLILLEPGIFLAYDALDGGEFPGRLLLHAHVIA